MKELEIYFAWFDGGYWYINFGLTEPETALDFELYQNAKFTPDFKSIDNLPNKYVELIKSERIRIITGKYQPREGEIRPNYNIHDKTHEVQVFRGNKWRCLTKSDIIRR